MKISYPYIKKKEIRENIFGVEIVDPYRHLENLKSKEVREWIEKENQLTENFLKKLPDRNYYLKELKRVYLKKSISLPYQIKNNSFFFFKRFPAKEQPVLYMSKGTFKPERARIVIDPNRYGKNVSLDWFYVSPDAEYIAYGLSEGGTELSTLFVMDIKKKKLLRDKIPDTKWGSVVWLPDSSGFYYTRNVDKKGFKPYIFLHRLGTSYKRDEYIYGEGLPETHLPHIYSSSDGKYMFLTIIRWGKNDLYFKSIEGNEDFIPIAVDKDGEFVGDTVGESIIIKTTYLAPRGRIVKTEIKEPSKKWEEIVHQEKRILKGFYILNEGMVLLYNKDTFTEIEIHRKNRKKKLKLPDRGTAVVSSHRERNDIYFLFTSFFHPPVIKRYNMVNHEEVEIWRMEADYNTEDYTQKFIFYRSKDGTKIPMYIIHKKGINLNGNNPTILYGYGGFKISMTPFYNKSIIPWIKKGGIYAIAAIRGGGEYGDSWHKAGRRENKQNVFDDFIWAARYLIKKRFTSEEKLAIHGGSNGGLLVGAVMIQEPHLFKAVVCDVPLLDMIRYHKFSVGYIWKDEYGDPEKEEDFRYLIKYSPYHNIKEDVEYPHVLFRTAEGDTRVHPMHAMKMAAYLQSIARKNVVLLYVEPEAGHGAGKPMKKFIQDNADAFSFISWALKE